MQDVRPHVHLWMLAVLEKNFFALLFPLAFPPPLFTLVVVAFPEHPIIASTSQSRSH